MKGWVARHTGLPSVRPAGPGQVWAGERLLTVARGAGQDVAPVSDPLAPVGVPVTYVQGREQVTLVRSAPAGVPLSLGTVTTVTGRTVPGLCWVADGAPASYPTAVEVSAALSVRWPLVSPPVTGSSDLVLLEPQRLDEAVSLLRAHAPVVLLAPASASGLPPVRTVVVTGISSRRLGTGGQTRLKVTWSERPPGAPAGGGCGAPVVTWGEWQALDHGWARRTYLDLCRVVAGMPS